MSYSHKSFEYKFVFIREKHLIRISYTINTEFWLHNFWVQVWNLYSNVLRRWDLVWFPYHETGLHWNKEMTRHNLCLSKSKTFYVAFNDIPVNFWQSAAVLIVDETRFNSGKTIELWKVTDKIYYIKLICGTLPYGRGDFATLKAIMNWLYKETTIFLSWDLNKYVF